MSQRASARLFWNQGPAMPAFCSRSGQGLRCLVLPQATRVCEQSRTGIWWPSSSSSVAGRFRFRSSLGCDERLAVDCQYQSQALKQRTETVVETSRDKNVEATAIQNLHVTRASPLDPAPAAGKSGQVVSRALLREARHLLVALLVPSFPARRIKILQKTSYRTEPNWALISRILQPHCGLLAVVSGLRAAIRGGPQIARFQAGLQLRCAPAAISSLVPWLFGAPWQEAHLTGSRPRERPHVKQLAAEPRVALGQLAALSSALRPGCGYRQRTAFC